MESKNLNDIVIDDNENSKKTQLKNILTLLALLFIILVISIVITKLILGNDEEENNETNKSAIVETQNGGSSTAGAVIGTTAALGTAAVLANRNLGDSKGENTKSALMERNSSSTHKKIPLRDHTPKKVKKHTVHHTTHHRDTYVKHHPKPTVKPVVHHRAKKSSITNIEKGYYIQIGAFKDPSSAIKNIKKDHLSYKTEKIKNGELTRVLVGPYHSHKEAQDDLSKVKEDISKNAYIKKF